ncbi:MaoC/PaaZ C-terminal domain-containing protein [Oscillospiraceae bacterium LTW-04]|nr:MaoC/PaaZ C-terminal domain-containing protein [Oscillospiraceae bacterium MB24-C1]
MDKLPFHIPFAQISIGDSASIVVDITQQLISDYAVFIGDKDSFHLSPKLNQVTTYERQVCQGSLLLGYFSLLAAQNLPGFGAILCKVDYDFEKPVYLGDQMTFSVVVAQKCDRRKLILEAKAVNQQSQRCISGSLIIKTLN